MEKRSWVAWFTQETNKTSRQEACTAYIGRRHPSVLPKERRHWGLPGQILETQAKLVGLAGSVLQMETQPEFERERATWVDQYFEELIPILYFPGSVFIHWGVIQKSCGDSITFIKVRCFIQMYTEVLGVLHHPLAWGACWKFMILSLWKPSVKTYFSRGDYS